MELMRTCKSALNIILCLVIIILPLFAVSKASDFSAAVNKIFSASETAVIICKIKSAEIIAWNKTEDFFRSSFLPGSLFGSHAGSDLSWRWTQHFRGPLRYIIVYSCSSKAHS